MVVSRTNMRYRCWHGASIHDHKVEFALMTTLDSSAAPSNALRMWADNVRIYVELPGSPPHILAFTYSESGLSKALSLLRRPYEFGGEPMLAPPPPMALADATLQSILRRKGLIR